MNDEILKITADAENYTIYTSMCKAQRILMRSYDPICSISGGSDSDLVLDLIHKIDEDGKVTYYWIDTGLEYTATKEHLGYLEQKYGIEIKRLKPDKPIPTCVRQYGVPFLSKYVSEQMMRLQKHHFQWEDESLETLLKKYPKCKTALQWWCNAYYTPENGIQQMSRFSISRNKWLKEFIIANPPDFPISNKCCEYAKKIPAKRFIKETDADLEITGIRKAEGCGCPVDTSAKQKHRPNRQVRLVSGLPITRLVSLKASQKTAIHIARYSGTRTAIDEIMSRCSM